MSQFIGAGFGFAVIVCAIAAFLVPAPLWWTLPITGAVAGAWLGQPEGARWSPPITAMLAAGGAIAGLIAAGVKLAIS